MTSTSEGLFRKQECPSCGAPIIYREGDSSATCDYCGSKATLNSYQTIHIIDEAKIKEVELKRDILQQEQRESVDREATRKKYNTLRTIVVAAAIIGFFASGLSPIFTIIFLVAIFYGVISLPKMNPDRKKLIREMKSNGKLISKKSRTTAFCLCFFLGWLGVHRFYAEKIGTGILYLFTFGLFGIGALVDLIRIAIGKFEDKNGRVIFE